MRLMQAFRSLSTLLLAAALAGIAVMLAVDAAHHLNPSSAHQHAGAFPLILIGLSYICLQPTGKRSPREMIQGALLGLAFVFWGGEQLLPPTKLTTLMDEAVVAIFVVDLGLMIVGHLQNKENEPPTG